MKSLRQRAVAGGAIWATVVVVAGTDAVASYLEGLTLSRFDAQLTARQTQAVVALANTRGDNDAMQAELNDPIYRRPFSGNYWQATSDDGNIAVSPSLADSLLDVPSVPAGDAVFYQMVGPANQSLRAVSRQTTIDDGTGWIITVASSTNALEADQAELQRGLNLSFAFVGILATAGAFLLVLFTLRPLADLRKDVIARKDQEGNLPVDKYPQEVQPLVADINELLERNRDILERSRRQTVDLAHALKTPSAVLRNELFELQQQGVSVQKGINALDRLDAQVTRSFARMKASQDKSLERTSTNLEISLARLGRAFKALGKNNNREVVLDICPGLSGKINQIDFEEIIGNLLDNALKWSESTIKLTSFPSGKWVHIQVEDDGPGVMDGFEKELFVGGQRLDESKPGTGFGLAIAADLVAAYKGEIQFARSATLGGALVTVTLKKSVED